MSSIRDPFKNIFNSSDELYSPLLDYEQLQRVLQTANIAPGPSVPKPRYTPEQMIYMRLHVQELSPPMFQFLTAQKLNDEKYVVFVINKGQYVSIEDDASLFPSDTLISQLRMLKP